MDSHWKAEQLHKIVSNVNEHVFKYIPEEIGNILYCDSTTPNKYPLSTDEIKKRRIWIIFISIFIILIYWSFLYEHYILGTLITIVTILVALFFYDSSFSGTDYLIGDKGFAILDFNEKRDNIVSKKVVLFDDLSYFFTGETIRKVNYSYSGTDYYFTVYFNCNEESNTYEVAHSTTGSYNDKRPKDPFNPDGADEEYCFMKALEKIWTNYFLHKHINEKELAFSLIDKTKLYPDCIVIKSSGIQVGDIEYNKSNTKKIYFDNGSLVIEHINHVKKIFGFVEKGNISSIPLSKIGNRQSFLLLFESIYKV